MKAKLGSLRKQSIASQTLFLLFLFFIFLLGIKLLESSFKLLGHDFAVMLMNATDNPFISLFIGILATVLVQSSSVTTSMIVGMVSGGILTVAHAIPMIMGANIGTSVTNSLVSTAHISRRSEFYRAFSAATIHDFFNILSVAILFPFELATGYLEKLSSHVAHLFYGAHQGVTYKSPIKVAVGIPAKAIQNFFTHTLHFSDQWTGILMIALAVIFIFLALAFITKTLKKVMVSKIEKTIDRVFSANALLTIGMGVLMTVMVQSSSITTSILVPMAATGILSLQNAFPLTLGANIGTTVTALLASLAGNISGLTIALVHLFFNITGILLIYPIPQIRQIPIKMAIGLARRATVRKRYAFFYIVSVFFLVPLAFILLSRLW